MDHVRKYLGLPEKKKKMIPAFPNMPELPKYDKPVFEREFQKEWPSCCQNCLNRPDRIGSSGFCMCTLPYAENPTW